MKKLVLLALIALGMNQVSAQSFSAAHDSVTVYTSGSVDVHNTVLNLTSSDLQVDWKVMSHTLGAGWTSGGVCDNITCYDWQTIQTGTTQTTNPITAAGNMDLKVVLDASNAANGTSTVVKIRITDPSSFTTKDVTYIAHKVPVSVNNVTKNDDNISIYPNPAKDDINVVFDGNTGIKNIAIYNLIGKAVSIYKVNGNSAKLNLSSIPSGIYFLRLLDNQGRIVATRKFTHQ